MFAVSCIFVKCSTICDTQLTAINTEHSFYAFVKTKSSNLQSHASMKMHYQTQNTHSYSNLCTGQEEQDGSEDRGEGLRVI